MPETNELHRVLGSLEGKMDIMLRNQTANALILTAIENRVNHVENRVTSIEASKDTRKADMALLFSIVGMLGVMFNSMKDWIFK